MKSRGNNLGIKTVSSTTNKKEKKKSILLFLFYFYFFLLVVLDPVWILVLLPLDFVMSLKKINKQM